MDRGVFQSEPESASAVSGGVGVSGRGGSIGSSRIGGGTVFLIGGQRIEFPGRLFNLAADLQSLRLQPCVLFGAGEVDLDRGVDLRMEDDSDVVQAEAFQCPLKHDLVAVDLQVHGFASLGDVPRGDRAVEIAAFGSLPDDDDGESLNFGGDGFGLLLALEVAGFDLGPVALEAGAVLGRGAGRLAPRQKIVARVAVLDLDQIAHLAQALHPFEKHDLHGGPLSGCVWKQGKVAGALDRPGKFALLAGRNGGDPARHDLSMFGEEAQQQACVLVVNDRRVASLERA